MSLQCQCLTAKKTQCSRNASQGSKYCFQHQSCSNVFGIKSVSAPKPVSAIVSPMKAEEFYAKQYQYQQEEEAKINAIEPILDNFKNSDYQKLILEDGDGGDLKVVFTKDILTKDNKYVTGECFQNGKKIKCKVLPGVYRLDDILEYFLVELIEDGFSHRME